jgi:hypothetical protein
VISAQSDFSWPSQLDFVRTQPLTIAVMLTVKEPAATQR